jgi:hypothetical protein
MCLGQGAVKSPVVPAVAPAPTRPAVAAAGTTDPTTLANIAAKTAKKRLGVFGNVNTTPMGDASYGTSSFATFGKAA